MDRFYGEGAGAGPFGTFQPEAVAASHRLVEQLREIGGSIAVSPEARVGFEHRIIDPWVAEHPLRDITFVRDSPVARFAEQVEDAGGVSESVGTVEELAIVLSQQARIYLADLPRQMRGEADLMRLDMLASQDLAWNAAGTCMWPPPPPAASRPPAKAFRPSSTTSDESCSRKGAGSWPLR